MERVEYHPIKCSLFRTFWEASRRLERAAGEASGEDIVLPLIRATQARFAIAVTPLPFSGFAYFRGPTDSGSLVDRLCLVYPAMAPEIRDFAIAMRALAASAENPLLDQITHVCTEFGAESDGGAVVVRSQSVADRCRPYFDSQADFTNWEVVDPHELRGPRTYLRLVLAGPTTWFPDHVFGSPRAPELHVVSYAWLLRSWRPQSLFVGGSWVQVPRGRSEPPEWEPAEPVESWPELDWGEIERLAIESSGDGLEHPHDAVEARLFLLGEGNAVFLDVSQGSTSLVIDPDAEDDDRVKRVLTDEIAPGTFLLRRTEGGGEYIIPLADKILGKRAGSHRAMQADWKHRLREQVANSPQSDSNSRLLDVCMRLLDLGAHLADETNLRYWMSPRSICTRDPRDFRAIMELVGLSADAEKRWGVMRQILAAHLQAGRRIRRRLIERVRELDPSELAGRRRLDFALSEEEGGRLTALLVERRSPGRFMVPVAREGRILSSEELQWRE
jgi:hypothetical protein